MQAAQEMQRNNPELFESMQQQAAQFAAGAQPQQQGQQQGPNDSSSSDSKSSEQDKKQWKVYLIHFMYTSIAAPIFFMMYKLINDHYRIVAWEEARAYSKWV